MIKEVEVIVEVPVRDLLEPLSVRPSDHPAGLVCLEEPDDEANTWTWTDENGEVTRFGDFFGVYTAGIQRGWAAALALETAFPEDRYRHRVTQGAWHAQCASYHGISLSPEGDYATGPDDWSQ